MNWGRMVREVGLWVLVGGILFGQGAWGQYDDGDGSAEFPFEIAEPNQLIYMSEHPEDWDKHFLLTADINLALADPNTFTTALVAPDPNHSTSGFQGEPFTGYIEGAGHKIHNLTIDMGISGYDYIGLIGWVESGEIHNLTLNNLSINGGYSIYYLGGLVGYNNHGTIINCHVIGNISGKSYTYHFGGLTGFNSGMIINCGTDVNINGYMRVGGLIGSNSWGNTGGYGNIINSYALGEVTGDSTLGGLVGFHYGTITNSFAMGTVTGENESQNVGGLVGESSSLGIITNCYATGMVYSGENSYKLGGLVGKCGNSGALSVIVNCYATGDVIGESQSKEIGGLIGSGISNIITHCYATGYVSGDADVGGLIGLSLLNKIKNCYFLHPDDGGGPLGGGGTPLTDEEMRQQTNFIGWDFVEENSNGTSQIWMMSTNPGYPIHSVSNGYSLPMPEGEGTASNPYLIQDPNNLGVIYHYPYSYYEIVSDIYLNGIIWGHSIAPIFYGALDGKNHSLAQLNIQGGGCLGMIGILAEEAMVKNIELVDIDISASIPAGIFGGLIGINHGTITDCSVTGNLTGYGTIGGLAGINKNIINHCFTNCVISGTGGLGGIAGSNEASISNCHSTGNIYGYNSLGGLVGSNRECTISNCYATGSITGENESEYLGGLIGWSRDSLFINCYATGNVTAGNESRFIGGLVGDISYDTFIDCFAQGNIEVGSYTNHIGGLVGWSAHGTLTYCYANGHVTGTRDVYFLGGLTGACTHNTIITNCHATGDVTVGSSSSESGGFAGLCSTSSISDSFGSGSVYCGGGSLYFGGLVGMTRENSIITNCYAIGNIIGEDYSTSGTGTDTLGGLIGKNNSDCSINECYATGHIEGGNNSGGLGGLCGSNDGNITKCYATGSVTGRDDSDYLGGLCGWNEGAINNCYARGLVISGDNSDYLGGLCGRNHEGSISYCYSSGLVTGSQLLGGLCGWNYQGSITNCYFLDTAGPDNGYGEPLDDPNMRIQGNFIDWDFVGDDNGTEDHWQMCIDGYDYPRLQWEFVGVGDFLRPGRVDSYDLMVLANDWLSTESRCCDIWPSGGDEIVNILDYHEFSRHWLKE